LKIQQNALAFWIINQLKQVVEDSTECFSFLTYQPAKASCWRFNRMF
jgi:hypothetical protein